MVAEVYGQTFGLASLRLALAVTLNLTRVSEDQTIVANISTSSAKTARGKPSAGTIQKIRTICSS